MAAFKNELLVDPSHAIALSDSWRVENVVFSPDSSALYVQYSDAVLSLWPVAVHFWPWILGVLVGLLGAICLTALFRIARRPQIAGHPHCRRCNYDLFGTTGQVCPECGLALTKRAPLLGRSRKQRALTWTLALTIGTVVYGALFAFRGWEPWTATLFRFDSAAALRIAKSGRAAWLERFIRHPSRIVEFNPATGKLVRSIADTGYSPEGTVLLSPDGSTLLFQDGRGNMRAIDPRSGREIAVAPRPDGLVGIGTWFAPGWRNVAGFSDDSASAFIQFFDGVAATNTLYRWDLATRSLSPVLVLESKSALGARGTLPFRRMRILSGTSPLLLAEIPDAHQEGVGHGNTIKVIIRNTEDDCRELLSLQGAFWAYSAPHVDVARKLVYVHEWDGIGTYDLTSGSRTATIDAPGFMGTVRDGLLFHQSTGLLFVSSSLPCQISVRDLEQARWIARLRFPAGRGLPPSYFAVSTDGRRVAAGFTDPGPDDGVQLMTTTSMTAMAAKFRDKLVIFDLPPKPQQDVK
jgi:hypothetical protein